MNYDQRIRIQAEKPGRTGFLLTLGNELAYTLEALIRLAIIAGMLYGAWALWAPK